MVAATRPLTERQAALMRFIAKHRDEQGLSPTRAEMAEFQKVNLRTVEERVKALQSRGLLISNYGAHRSVRLTPEGHTAIGLRYGTGTAAAW